MMILIVCVILVVNFCCFKEISACNGYVLKVESAKNCDGSSVIKVPKGFDISLDKDCNLAFSGCVTVTKTIKSAPGTYSVKKPPLPPLDGEIDYCDVIREDEFPAVKQTLTALGIPPKCPIPAKTYCAKPNSKVSIAVFKNQLGLAVGTTNLKLTANHDSGKSCAEFVITVSKPRKG